MLPTVAKLIARVILELVKKLFFIPFDEAFDSMINIGGAFPELLSGPHMVAQKQKMESAEVAFCHSYFYFYFPQIRRLSQSRGLWPNCSAFGEGGNQRCTKDKPQPGLIDYRILPLYLYLEHRKRRIICLFWYCWFC